MLAIKVKKKRSLAFEQNDRVPETDHSTRREQFISSSHYYTEEIQISCLELPIVPQVQRLEVSQISTTLLMRKKGSIRRASINLRSTLENLNVQQTVLYAAAGHLRKNKRKNVAGVIGEQDRGNSKK
jgi:hypothetical protein